MAVTLEARLARGSHEHWLSLHFHVRASSLRGHCDGLYNSQEFWQTVRGFLELEHHRNEQLT